MSSYSGVSPVSPLKKTRCRGDGESAARDFEALPPVELGDALGGDAVVFEVRADAERGDEGDVEPGELADGHGVEVIVVVVRHHHRVERRERSDGHRDGLEALRPREGERRHALAPHRVGEHTATVDLDEHGGVPEPRGAQARLGRGLPVRERVARGERPRGLAPLAAAEVLAEGGGDGSLFEAGGDGVGVAEGAVDVARRREDALAAQALRAGGGVGHQCTSCE